MKVYCRKSGVSFLAEGFTNKMNIEAEHPIFSAPLRSLLNRSGDWASGRLTEVERKLLFLALLNSTKLVHFQCPAQPSDGVVQGNMEFLLTFIAWYSDIQSAQLKLPQFVISPSTNRMTNVNIWLKSWQERRKAWEDGFTIQTKREKLATKEAALYRLIHSASKHSEEYAGSLASWALEAANAPTALREFWTSIFRLKGLDIYKARTVDIEELLEHLEDNLPIYDTSIYANSVLTHIRKILQKNRAGLTYGLGIPDADLANLDLTQMAANPFHIVEDAVETANKEAIISTAPLEEPKLSDYPSKFAYLRAKAAYNLAAKQDRNIALLEEYNKKAADQAALEPTEEELSDDDLENQIKIVRETEHE